MPRVIVAGAGPAGAALSLLLARNGLEVTLLERAADFAREFRGEVLMPSGLDALGQMGLAEDLARLPQVRIDRFEFHVHGRLAATLRVEPEEVGGPMPRWLSQPALLELLVAKAEEAGPLRLERGTTVRGLLEESGRIVGVRALGDGGERELRADFVVGADGRSSSVRRRAGLPERADRTPMDVVWCKIPCPPALREDPRAFFCAGGGHILVAAPVYDGNLQLAWVIPKGSYGELRQRGIPSYIDAMTAQAPRELAEHLRAHRGDAIEPFLLWTVSDRVLRWWRPGLLVIGDAAHTMSPVGAQGINIALRDALVAANELVTALAEGARPDALDAAAARVQAEREPEIVTIQRLQSLPPRVLFRSARWADWLLRSLAVGAHLRARRGRGVRVPRAILSGTREVRLRV